MTYSREAASDKLAELKDLATRCWYLMDDIQECAMDVTNEKETTVNWLNKGGSNRSASELLDVLDIYHNPLEDIFGELIDENKQNEEPVDVDDSMKQKVKNSAYYSKSMVDNLSMMLQDAGATYADATNRATDFVNKTFGTTIKSLVEDTGNQPHYAEVQSDDTIYSIKILDVNERSSNGFYYTMDMLKTINDTYHEGTIDLVDDKVDLDYISMDSSIEFTVIGVKVTASSLYIDVARDGSLYPDEVRFIPVGSGVIGVNGQIEDYKFHKFSYKLLT